ncbi:MAG: hypothetical protein MZW92_39655 [Comamonadaceae bacterium]|nr:hypothetical protein [Comamonadaceae bacterium]
MPFGLGAARNLAPRWIYYAVPRRDRGLAHACSEVVVAILFVALFGFGPFAGFLTLTFATIGFIGKLLAEDIEDSRPRPARGDPRDRRGLVAAGQLWRAAAGDAAADRDCRLYRLDINFRESAVDRHRRCRRHRGHTEHRDRPLRVRRRRRRS